MRWVSFLLNREGKLRQRVNVMSRQCKDENCNGERKDLKMEKTSRRGLGKRLLMGEEPVGPYIDL